MRICYLADADSIHTQKWMRYFIHHGHTVFLLTFHKKVFFPLRLLIAAFVFRLQLRRIKPDLIHSHYITNYGLFAVLTGYKPHVTTAWGSDVLRIPENRAVAWIKKVITLIVLQHASMVTCDGVNSQAAIKQYGVDAELIRFGIDTVKFKPNRKRHSNPTVISTRSHKPLYNLQTLVRAIPTVLAEKPDAQFIIVGEGSQTPALKQEAVKLQVHHHTSFLGAVNNEDMPALLNKADLYVSTSLSDAGISSSTAEAMACGLPVVVTDTVENRMWIKDGGFTSPNDSDALAKVVVAMLNQTGESVGNRTVIVEHNNLDVEMRKMEQLYRNIL